MHRKGAVPRDLSKVLISVGSVERDQVGFYKFYRVAGSDSLQASGHQDKHSAKSRDRRGLVEQLSAISTSS